MKYILIDNNGYILSVAEKQLNENYIPTKNVPKLYQIYKFVGGKFVLDKNLEKEYKKFQTEQLKKRISKIVSNYINDLLNYLDYDDLADLNICEEIPMYQKEVKKIKKWIKTVYKKYEEICKDVEQGKKINVDNIENILPKYR